MSFWTGARGGGLSSEGWGQRDRVKTTERILMVSQGSGRNGRGEPGGRHTWGTQHPLSSRPPQKYYTDLPGMRLEPHTCTRNRTRSPQVSPMMELLVPSREPAAGSRAQGERWGSRERGQNLGLGTGPGPWGPPWPHICWTEGEQNLLWRGHQEESGS